jgi:hypothetical protein
MPQATLWTAEAVHWVPSCINPVAVKRLGQREAKPDTMTVTERDACAPDPSGPMRRNPPGGIMVKVSTRCPAIREDGLTDKEHAETATDIFLSGLRAGR